MKTILRITFLSLFIFAFGCSKEDNEVPFVVKSDAKAITSFSFAADDNAALNENLAATVTETSKTVSGTVPSGTEVTALTPTVQVSAKASISPIGAQDFSSPVTYTVTAEDGSTAKYTASVTVLEAENSAPLAFELIAVTDNAIEVDVLPIFSWNATTDPDGDTVTYNLYLNEGNTADQLYAENLSNTTLEVTERLGLLQDYTWRVVAKDSKGAIVSSNSRSFSTRSIRFSDGPLTAIADFGPRSGHTSVIFDNKIWVIGGRDETRALKNDVWFSSDGRVWEEATAEASFTPRASHTSVVFDNRIWVIGGAGLNAPKNDIWFSEDGVVWEEATSQAPFTRRTNHSSVVFDNKIWVIGGHGREEFVEDVLWFSSDGVNWANLSNSASFGKRESPTSVVFDNKIWLIGGRDELGIRQDDIWSSEDGINWSETTSESHFAGRMAHASVVFDNKLWVIGGVVANSVRKNDVWYSENGSVWKEAMTFGPFSARTNHTSVVYDNRVWVIGGFDDGGGNVNDVWTFD